MGHIVTAIYPTMEEYITKEDSKLLKMEEEFFKLAQKDSLSDEEEKRVDELETILIEELWEPLLKPLREDNAPIIAEA